MKGAKGMLDCMMIGKLERLTSGKSISLLTEDFFGIRAWCLELDLVSCTR
jgi:hypothetical protein